MECRNKVLYLLDDPTKDKHVHKFVLDGLTNSGFKPTILYFYGNEANSSMANEQINAYSLGLSKSEFKGLNLNAVKALNKFIRSNRFSIVHAQRHRPLIHSALALLGIKKTRLFYTVRATNVLRGVKRPLAFLCLGFKISKLICISYGVKDYVKKSLPFFPEKKLVVIHNGVDVKEFDLNITKKEARSLLNIPKDDFCFGIVARLKKAKNHEGLIVAFKELTCHFPNTNLIVVGDGPLENRLKNLTKDLGIFEKVFFVGKKAHKHIPKVLKAFDCFVHPSVREGLGVSVLEAMASGLPVIISDADGLKDIFSPRPGFRLSKEIGQMVKAKDVPSLFQAMRRYREMDLPKLQKIGHNAREHVSSFFTKELMVKKTVELYKDYLNNPG